MPILVDTGILLRMFVPADPACNSIRQALRNARRAGDETIAASQNIAEFCNVSTRPSHVRGGYGLTVVVVQSRVRFLERACRVVTETDYSYQRWKDLLSKYQVSGVGVHDARLVAIMLHRQIARILTLNPADFRRYEPEGIQVLTPVDLLNS